MDAESGAASRSYDWRGVAVARAVDALERTEPGIDGHELLTDPLDVTVNGAIADGRAIRIRVLHQLVAREHYPGATHQRLQQQAFRDRQRHNVLPPGGLQPHRIEVQVADVDG